MLFVNETINNFIQIHPNLANALLIYAQWQRSYYLVPPAVNDTGSGSGEGEILGTGSQNIKSQHDTDGGHETCHGRNLGTTCKLFAIIAQYCNLLNILMDTGWRPLSFVCKAVSGSLCKGKETLAGKKDTIVTTHHISANLVGQTTTLWLGMACPNLTNTITRSFWYDRPFLTW